jgi:Integrase core domain
MASKEARYEVVIAPRSPWQNAYAERVIRSIRRECLDRVVVISERDLRAILTKYGDHYNGSWPHLFLAEDAPEPRTVQRPSKLTTWQCRAWVDFITRTLAEPPHGEAGPFFVGTTEGT